MSAQISLERTKRARALFISAIQVILPDWVFPNEEESIAFLERMVESAHPVGLVLYNPPHGKRQLSPNQFGELARRVPSLLGAKVAGGDAEWYRALNEEMTGLSVFVLGHFLATGIEKGAHGPYSNVACIHPLGAQRWYDMMRYDLERAKAVQSDITGFMERRIAPLGRAGYTNMALDKLLAAIGGWSDVGTRLCWSYRFFDDKNVMYAATPVPEGSRLVLEALRIAKGLCAPLPDRIMTLK